MVPLPHHDDEDVGSLSINFNKQLHKSHVSGLPKQEQEEEEDCMRIGDLKKGFRCGGGGHVTSRCFICGKTFPSMKSLSGHMRCHPDRDWRGINPPPPPSSAVDLRESLRGWAVTAKRGRKGTAAAELTRSEDDGSNDAVDFLMMLAQGKNSGEGDGEVVDISHEQQSEKKKKKKKKKKRKKVKLSDLNLTEDINRNNKCNKEIRKGMADFDLNEVPPLEPDLAYSYASFSL